MKDLIKYSLIFLTVFHMKAGFCVSEFTNFVFNINQIQFDERITVQSIEELGPWYVIKGDFTGDKDLIINTGASLMESDLLSAFRFSGIIPIVHKQTFEIYFSATNKKHAKKILEIKTKSFQRDKQQELSIQGTCQKNGKSVELTNGFIPKITAKCKRGEWVAKFSLTNYKYNLLPLKAEQKIGFADSIIDYQSILIGQ